MGAFLMEAAFETLCIELQFARIEHLLPRRPGHVGRNSDKGTGCSWRRSSGSSAPARPGAIFPNVLAIGRILANDFPDGPKAAFWGSLFKTLADDLDTEYAMIDATIVRAHQHSAGARKKGIRTKRSAARVED
jgi:hypothetical protein